METLNAELGAHGENELQSTATQHRRPDIRQARKGWNSVRVFTDGFIASKIWFLIAAGAVIYAFVQPYLLIQIMKQQERVIALDSLGTIYVSPLQDFASAKELHASQITLAVTALLDRNPNGVDNPNLFKNMYLPAAYAAGQKMIDQDRDEFTSKQLHQKCEINSIEILETRESYILGKAEGKIIRSGVFNNAAFTEAVGFEMSLTLARNPDIRQNGKFPTAVYAFRFTTNQEH
jgi:hypothetical protein